MTMRSKALQYAGEARRHGYRADVLTWHTALDNYDPARSYASGYAVKYSGTLHDPETGFTAEYLTAGITMLCNELLPLSRLLRANALFDYGDSVQPYYLAGWNDQSNDKLRDPHYHWITGVQTAMWHPFPTAQPGEMTQHNPPRPLDYANWQLGPRKTYHFKTERYCNHDAPAVMYGTCECGQNITT
jgi:hypothetical protein